jgi:formate-nitrite transporter family protein
LPTLSELTPPLSAEDHVAGRDRAPLELVIFGDFQCPYCTAAYPILRRVRDQLAERLMFAFRHFPLRDVHPDAQRAAEAAEAAAAQGAFWEMHDRMYDSRGALSRADLISHAA